MRSRYLDGQIIRHLSQAAKEYEEQHGVKPDDDWKHAETQKVLRDEIFMNAKLQDEGWRNVVEAAFQIFKTGGYQNGPGQRFTSFKSFVDEDLIPEAMEKHGLDKENLRVATRTVYREGKRRGREYQGGLLSELMINPVEIDHPLKPGKRVKIGPDHVLVGLDLDDPATRPDINNIKQLSQFFGLQDESQLLENSGLTRDQLREELVSHLWKSREDVTKLRRMLNREEGDEEEHEIDPIQLSELVSNEELTIQVREYRDERGKTRKDYVLENPTPHELRVFETLLSKIDIKWQT